MNRKSTSGMGAFHPVLFFVVIYGISLFLALFVCSTVYYSLNDQKTDAETISKTNLEISNAAASGATAFR